MSNEIVELAKRFNANIAIEKLNRLRNVKAYGVEKKPKENRQHLV